MSVSARIYNYFKEVWPLVRFTPSVCQASATTFVRPPGLMMPLKGWWLVWAAGQSPCLTRVRRTPSPPWQAGSSRTGVAGARTSSYVVRATRSCAKQAERRTVAQSHVGEDPLSAAIIQRAKEEKASAKRQQCSKHEAERQQLDRARARDLSAKVYSPFAAARMEEDTYALWAPLGAAEQVRAKAHCKHDKAAHASLGAAQLRRRGRCRPLTLSPSSRATPLRRRWHAPSLLGGLGRAEASWVWAAGAASSALARDFEAQSGLDVHRLQAPSGL